MKTLYKILFSAIILVAISESVKAQDIEGMDLWDKVTKEQIIAKFGQPKQYEAQLMDDMKSYHKLFTYDDLYIETEDNILVFFTVKGKHYNLLTKYIKGGVRVGESITKIGTLKVPLNRERPLSSGEIQYRYIYDNENMLYVNVLNGIITNIYSQAFTL